jgi:hypothetical protein
MTEYAVEIRPDFLERNPRRSRSLPPRSWIWNGLDADATAATASQRRDALWESRRSLEEARRASRAARQGSFTARKAGPFLEERHPRVSRRCDPEPAEAAEAD